MEDPWFSRVFTVSERPEDMWSSVYRYKYEGERDRAAGLGRLLAGYLQARSADLATYDAITTCALYVGPGAPRLWDYLKPVLDAAQRRTTVVPVEHDLIAKGGPTDRFLGLGTQERRVIAEGSLRAVLTVPRPERVAGRRILVFDDVYSEGFSLREMARTLRLAGAVEVAGLVLTRRKGC
ncbi:MAG: hypothetical protein M3P48_01395 [Actinomycetota bacterium]|nr:hypothetical protein [Actinomycetota bacterium]